MRDFLRYSVKVWWRKQVRCQGELKTCLYVDNIRGEMFTVVRNGGRSPAYGFLCYDIEILVAGRCWFVWLGSWQIECPRRLFCICVTNTFRNTRKLFDSTFNVNLFSSWKYVRILERQIRQVGVQDRSSYAPSFVELHNYRDRVHYGIGLMLFYIVHSVLLLEGRASEGSMSNSFIHLTLVVWSST